MLDPWKKRDRKSANDQYAGSRVYTWLDDRLDLQDGMLGKAFPEDKYGSFLLGEVALFSFVLLSLTGTFLGLLYAPVATKGMEYSGQVQSYTGKTLPGAFASVLRISYDIRLGMYFRMMHHWAAYLFIAAIALHMFRVFFSGVYRNPRELNWVVGSLLLLLALGEGFLGYSLPYDNFSKTATSIGFEITNTIPVIGGQLVKLLFGGGFPSNADVVLPRIFFLHVFLLPAAIAALIAVHMGLLIRQKHTEQRSARDEVDEIEDKDDKSIVAGVPLVPNQAAMTVIVFSFTTAVISFMAALFPIQRIAITGPADPLSTPPGVVPAWFLMWVYGILKVVPSGLGSLGRFLGGVIIPTIIIGVLVIWPFIDRSTEQITFAVNPLDRPAPTAVGVAAITFINLTSLAGMNSQIAETFDTTIGALGTPLLVLVVVVPILYGLIVYFMLRRRLERKGKTTAAQIQPGD
ncbi:cytochrome B6 [Haladaptatus sp. R4]|nr:cytochrome B6 [Haladaptatus sp. R4]